MRPTSRVTPPAPRTGARTRTRARAHGGLGAAGRPVPLLVATAAAGALTAALAQRAGDLAPDDPARWALGTVVTPAVRVEDLVGLAAVVVGTAVAGWFAVALALATVCATARAVGRAWVAGERVVGRVAPRTVRRAFALSAGAGVAVAGVAIPAAGAVPPPDDLGWSVTGAPAPAPASAPAPPAGPATSGDRTLDGVVVVVRPGDTLWGIARDHLPPDADVGDVAAAWPSWYAANAGVVGPDPDLIRPGQRLVGPAGVGAVVVDR